MKALVLTALLAGCGGAAGPQGRRVDGANERPASAKAGAVEAHSGLARSPLVLARPYQVAVPPSYDPGIPTPLVLLLHGYGVDGRFQAMYFGLLPGPGTPEPRFAAVNRHGFLLAYPDGSKNAAGKRFWNATDVCCAEAGDDVDDVAYLTAVLDDVEARYNVDRRWIYVVGHSNGAFMAHRFACDRAERVAAVVALAGAPWTDPERCKPSRPINVLVVHGDADQTIAYSGGVSVKGLPYRSARSGVALWAAKNLCSGTLADGAPKDLDSLIGGAETGTRTMSGCADNGSVDFWTIHGGAHIPALGKAWPDELWSYLAAHGRRQERPGAAPDGARP